MMNRQLTGLKNPIAEAVAQTTLQISGAEDSPFLTLIRIGESRPDTITLGRGEPDIPTPAHIVEAAKRALDHGETTYTDPAGLLELREAIAEKLRRDNSVTYDPESEIIVTTGAQEAIALVMQTLLNPGDEVLLASPFYNAYEVNIRMAGGIPVLVPTRESQDFEILPAEIEARITDRTKLLALVSPNNPTAAVIQPATLGKIADVARRHDLVVLSDELYEKVVYDDFKPVSIATLPQMRERTILVNGFSKAYSMTGFRVGYLAAPREYCRLALEPRHALTISTPTPSQYAALAALTGPQDHIREMLREYTLRRAMMAEAFDALDVTYSKPMGAFYFFANIAGAGVGSMEFCTRAVRDHGLLFFPGSMYGPDADAYARISFLAPRPELHQGLERFAALYRACVAER